jgi:hypothetical protein
MEKGKYNILNFKLYYIIQGKNDKIKKQRWNYVNSINNNNSTKPLSRWSYIIKEIKTSKILENIENTP